MKLTFALTNMQVLKRQDEICSAFLIAQDEEGHYEPVALVSSMNEAQELAESDMASRLRRLDRDEDPGLCPYEYIVWARGVSGNYHIIARALVAVQDADEAEAGGVR